MAAETVSRATIVLYNGAEQPLASEPDVLLHFRNNYGVNQSSWVKGPVIQLNLQYFNGPGDDYTITAWVKGYRGTGAFVKADPTTHKLIRLMLIPLPAMLTFRPWSELKAQYPQPAKLLALNHPGDAAAEQFYLGLQTSNPAALACFLNLVTAMADINLGGQQTPLDFLKEVRWDYHFAQDRFFAYIDPEMIKFVVAGAQDGEFAQEPNPGAFHPGATLSYKQVEFDYSNVQLTFHQDPADSKQIDGIACITFEPDMDLYKDLLDHGLLEVLPNLLTHGLTDPIDILSLRWLDATDANQPPFDPGYTLTPLIVSHPSDPPPQPPGTTPSS